MDPRHRDKFPGDVAISRAKADQLNKEADEKLTVRD